MAKGRAQLTGFKKHKLAIAVALPLLTTGCLYDEDNAPDGRSGGAVSSGGSSGVAIDGYLRSAKACLDRNENMSCDAGEESDITDDRGRFDLNVSDADAAAFPVVVEAIANLTIDMDNPGQTISQAYSMSAPAGQHGVVNPLTSLVESLRASGKTKADAEQQVMTELGVPSADMLYDDFIAKSDAQSKKLHSTSQVIIQVLSSTLEASPSQSENTDRAVVNSIGMRKIATGQLAAIKTAVDGAVQADGSLSLQQVQQVSTDLYNDKKSELDVSTAEFNAEKAKPGSVANPNLPAPTLTSASDATDELRWGWVAGLKAPSDYEYSTDGGSSWQPATANPQSLPDAPIAKGDLQLRVVANAAVGRTAGEILTVDMAFTTRPDKPAAPTAALVNDAQNTFGWTEAPGFNQVDAYEYSVDGGSTWQQVSANPQPVQDINIVSGDVQVRVKADEVTGRPAGAVLSSANPFTKTPSEPAGPTSLVVDDAQNQFAWTYSAASSNAADYEYSVDGGSNWAAATANPQSIGDIAVAIGDLQLRIAARASDGRPASAVLSSTAAFTVTPATPAAPTSPVVNDALNMFGWSYVSGFGLPASYEYSVDGGSTWQAATANPQPLSDAASNVGDVRVRVAGDAQTGRAPSAALLSDKVYTLTPARPDAPTSPVHSDAQNTFGWTVVAGFTPASEYEVSTDNGASWQVASANPQVIADSDFAVGAVQVRVRANSLNGRAASPALISTKAYTATPAAPAAPTAAVVDDAANTFDWVYVTGFTAHADYEYSLDGGSTWNAVTAKPQGVPDQAYAVGIVRVRVAADSETARPAGAPLNSDRGYTVTPEKPATPTSPVIDDSANTFGWAWATDYAAVAEYEFSVDNGSSWNQATINPQPVGDSNIASGHVQVRVKADPLTGRPVGDALSSDAAYTVTPGAPDAPSAPVVDDNLNRFGWTNTSGYSAIGDYEYSVDSGISWQANTANPQPLSDADLPSGSVWVRVVADADNGRPAGSPLKSNAAFTVTPAAPAAPTAPLVDDAANTFGWTAVSGFEQADNYEYSTDSGSTWQAVTANPQNVGDSAYAVGAVRVRVAKDESNARPAGAVLQSDAAYTVTPGAPAAPTGGIVNNAANTFGWSNVAGYSNATDYEYSTDGGTNWHAATANPQLLSDQNYAAGAVRVRVAGDVHTGRPAGAVLQSSAAYTVTPEQPAAPTAAVHSDAANTFGWTVVSGFTQISDYEISLDSGISWQAVSANPQTIPDAAYASGEVRVRVAANTSDGRPAGRVLQSSEAYTVTPGRPSAPTSPTQDDAANTFGWTVSSGFTDAADYEYSTDGGANWNAVTINPIAVGDVVIASGDLQVRVAADSETGRPESLALVSTVDFTKTPAAPAAPTSPVHDDLANTFGWTNVAGFTAASDYEISADGGQNWQAVSANPASVSSGAIASGDVQVRVAKDDSNGRPVGAALSSTAAYTPTPEAPAAPTNGAVDDAANTFDWVNVLGFAEASGYEYSSDSGANWTAVTAKPVSVGDVAIASGAFQLRVAADSATGRPAGAALLSGAAFTKSAASAVSKEQAIISGTHFAKLDNSGNYIAASSTLADGWRCVQDLSAGNKVVWALLKDGGVGGEDDVLWSEGQTLISDMNSGSVCGFNDWQVPTRTELKSLRTIESGSNKTIDPQVFPNHKPDTDELANSATYDQYLYYWSNDDWYDERYLYRFYKTLGKHPSYNESESTSLSITATSKNKIALLRAKREDTRFVKFNGLGTQLPSDSTNWTCLQDNRPLSPTVWLNNSEVSGEVGYAAALVKIAQKNTEKVCGFNDWKLPQESDIQLLIDSGEWSKSPWYLSGYDYVWTSTPGDDDTEAKAVSGFGSIYSQSKGDNNHIFAIRQKLDPVAAVASMSATLQALQAKEVAFATSAQTSASDFNTAKSAYDGAVVGADLSVYDAAKTVLEAQQVLIDTRYTTLQQDFVVLEQRVIAARATQASIANNADGNFSTVQIQQAATLVGQINTLWTAMSGQRNTTFDHKTQLAEYLEHFRQIYQVLNGGTGSDGVVAVQALTADVQALQAQLETAIAEANAAQAAIDALNGTTDSAAAQRAVDAAKDAFAKVEAIRLKLLALDDAIKTLQAAVNGLEANVSAAVEALANSATNAANSAKNLVVPVQQTGRVEGAESYEKAREAGWSVSEDDAKIAGTEFAKLDVKGRFLPSDTAFTEGWRCVRDLRQGSAELTWALLEDGAKDGANDLSWDMTDTSVSDAQGLIVRYNAESYCGYSNWQVPMRHYLKTLETGSVKDDYNREYATIDLAVFPNHRGFTAEFTNSSYGSPRYWYWSSDGYNSSSNYIYKYADPENTSSSDNESTDANVAKSETVVLRPMRLNERFERVDGSGQVTTDDSQWVCTREIGTGVLWTRQSGGSAIAVDKMQYADALTLIEAQNAASLCGRANWQLPSIAQLQVLSPLESPLFSDIQRSSSDAYWSNEANGAGFSGNKNKCYDFKNFALDEYNCAIDGNWPDSNYTRLTSPSS
ncbi:MAG: DUF1566 domain-containing protein [Pseudomonadales bacterium]